MSRTSLRLAALLIASALGCSRSAGPTVETTLPVAPGEAWDDARAALVRLDPAVQDATAVGSRASTAKAEVVVAGVRFQQLMITAPADRPRVRSVSLAAPPPSGDCAKIRSELLRALGPAWSEGETRLGATLATRESRVARIVCNGAELSLTIAG